MFNKKSSMIVGALVLILFASLLYSPKTALACSCVERGTIQDTMNKSDAVFEGTAVSVKPSAAAWLRSNGTSVKTSFQVSEVWKGHVAPKIEVLTAGSEDSCGYTFKEGERYLVYARATGAALEVNLCSGTLLRSDADSHIAQLGSGSLPPQPLSAEEQEGESFPRSLVIFILIVVLGSSFLILFMMKSKQLKSRT
ncbi:hypothetical protein [Paenibacillus sinopodophylli]|uniref:hypothetical protein n=1 Tax=Paenibacillus sinopodophylli TaxID=1837342 RepID=UPI001486CA2D|nr:hypothetical protein [Paenibacillus sinopodophylli]